MRERTIERAFKRAVERKGGVVRKLVTPGRRHAPDRLVIMPRPRSPYDLDARVIFVELKRPGKRPRKGQQREHERLRKLGCEVYVICSLYDVENFVGWL